MLTTQLLSVCDGASCSCWMHTGSGCEERVRKELRVCWSSRKGSLKLKSTYSLHGSSHSKMQRRSASFDVPCLGNQNWKKGNKIHSLHAGRLLWCAWSCPGERISGLWDARRGEETQRREVHRAPAFCAMSMSGFALVHFTAAHLCYINLLYIDACQSHFSLLSESASKAVLLNF